jgi:hypothetical protein
MRRVGAMRTVLTAMHPRLTGSEGFVFEQDLEIERRRRMASDLSASGTPWQSITDAVGDGI